MNKPIAQSADFIDDGCCFACGPSSKYGLHMRFHGGDDGVSSEFILPQWLQGWRGVAHGGVVTMVLDEAMAHAVGHTGRLGVTADMQTRFRKPVPLGAVLHVAGRVIEENHKLLTTQAELRDSRGSLLASASARFLVQGTLPPGVRLGERSEDGDREDHG